MKKGYRIALMAICISLLMMLTGMAAHAEMSQEEADLRWLLSDMTGTDSFPFFCCGDYDGDGVQEAFALVGREDEFSGYRGDIWFVSPYTVEKLQEGMSYYDAQMGGSSAPLSFSAEEWYGGSGSTAHMWIVYNGEPCPINVNLGGGISHGEGNNFYAYPSAFDAWSDGTGHTWKRYYYFLDGPELREYGGIEISIYDLMKFQGAKEIITRVESEGWTIGTIYYRGNGIINVNLRSGKKQDHLTLRYDESSVVDLDISYGGHYSRANTPEVAVYPDKFVEPVSVSSAPVQSAASGAHQAALNELGVFNYDDLYNIRKVDHSAEGGYQSFNVWYEDGVFYGGSDGYVEKWLTAEGIIAETEYDLDGDGAMEYVALYVTHEADEWDYVSPRYRIAIYEMNGASMTKTADFETSFDYEGMHEARFAAIVPSPKGNVIVAGTHTGIAVFTYDGSSAYVDLIVTANEYFSSYALTARLPAENYMDVAWALVYYMDYPDRLGKYVSVNDQTLHYYALPFNEDYGTPKQNYLDAYAACAAYAEPYGIFIRYGEELQLNGIYLAQSDEVRRDDGWHNEIRCLTSLNHMGAAQAAAQTSGTAPLLQVPGSAIAATNPPVTGGILQVPGSAIIATNPPVTGGILQVPGSAITATNPPASGGMLQVPGSAITGATNAPLPTPAPVRTGTVYFHGDSNLRSGPGLNYALVSSVTAGKSLTWLGDSSVDNRGVVWYKVRRKNGESAWVSSRYSQLKTSDGSEPAVPFGKLMNGSKGEKVRELQEMLAQLGYHTGSCDGSYGNQTAKSVKAFQNAYGLPATGEADEATWNALCAAVGK